MPCLAVRASLIIKCRGYEPDPRAYPRPQVSACFACRGHLHPQGGVGTVGCGDSRRTAVHPFTRGRDIKSLTVMPRQGYSHRAGGGAGGESPLPDRAFDSWITGTTGAATTPTPACTGRLRAVTRTRRPVARPPRAPIRRAVPPASARQPLPGRKYHGYAFLTARSDEAGSGRSIAPAVQP